MLRFTITQDKTVLAKGTRPEGDAVIDAQAGDTVKLNIQASDIVKDERRGDDRILHMENGCEITLKNFYSGDQAADRCLWLLNEESVYEIYDTPASAKMGLAGLGLFGLAAAGGTAAISGDQRR